MRTRFSTRAVLVGLAPVTALTLRAVPTGGEQGFAPGVPQAAAAVPVDAVEASYPLDREDAPEVSQSEIDAAGLTWPAPGPITSPFGGKRRHPGIDIDGVTGDPVRAAGQGTVVLAGMVPGYEGYGNLVMIEHGSGISTLYAHLSRVDVTLGEQIEQGQVVGAIGATGLAFGDHLHFEVRVTNHPVDPV